MFDELALLFPCPRCVTLSDGRRVGLRPLLLRDLRAVKAHLAILSALMGVTPGNLPPAEDLARLLVTTRGAIDALREAIEDLFHIGTIAALDLPSIAGEAWEANRLGEILAPRPDAPAPANVSWGRMCLSFSRAFGWTPDQIGSIALTQFLAYGEALSQAAEPKGEGEPREDGEDETPPLDMSKASDFGIGTRRVR